VSRGRSEHYFWQGEEIKSTIILFSSQKGRRGTARTLVRRWGNKHGQMYGKGARRKKFLARRRIMSTIIMFSSRKGRGETAKTFY
jgi:hypothetical protein